MGKPKIRFKGYADDWEQRKLGDICKMNGRIGFRGYTEKDIVAKEAGGVLTFSPTNIVGNQLIVGLNNTYITKEKYEESPEIKVQNGNILFVKTGSTLGKSALVVGIGEDCTVNPQVVVIKVKPDLQKILSVALTSMPIQKQITAVKIGGAVPTMTETELKNIDLILPQRSDERIKIGQYFKNLDHLITLHQRKCDETKKLKKYMLQKMFPQNGEKVPKIRFAGFSDDWEQRKVGDITKELSEYAKLNSGLPLLTSARTGLMYQSDYRGNSTTDNENTLFSIVPLNACTYRHMSDDSTFHINVNTLEKGLVSKEYPVFVENESDLRFVVQYINSSDSFTKFCTEQKKGGTRTRLYYKTLCEYKMLIPSLNEQHIIADYFDNLDYLITLHQQKCDELQNIKKFMLKNMFA